MNAVVTVSRSRAAALKTANKPVPKPVPIRALVDTGASCSSVDPDVLAKLSLTPTGVASLFTSSTGAQPHDCDQYDVGLLIPGPPGAQPFLKETVPVVAASFFEHHGFHALVGRDVLSSCVLTYNGSMGWFTLAF
ncbi:MAG TPA: hypothetical protein VKU40_10565 [Thermoanaerobaculia bacterium]|nr:hypothetical protein [Thermoanaerobaculia bacterium]